jgi:hypothetical protein
MLPLKYKDEMQGLEKGIEKKQMIIKLHDLEDTKASLVEMLHSKLDEINRNIENIKITHGIPSMEPPQVKVQPPQQAETQPVKTKKEQEKPPPKIRLKSKAEANVVDGGRIPVHPARRICERGGPCDP